MRIATPVCALVRNDMQKAVACQRLQGRFPAVPWQRPLANADTRQISACHCEERSDGTIRSPCSSTKRKAILPGKSVEAANLPYVLLSCQVFLRGNGLPHQCAHWFAMTCRRKRRCCGCKDAFRQYPGSAPWQTQTPGKFLPVIARSEATRQSVLLAAAQNEKPFFPARCRKEARQD